jgi:hypothetical protein
MTNSINNAIARIQDISLAMTSVKIKSAPDFPIENIDPLPMSVAYLAGGRAQAVNASTVNFFPNVNVEFHFNRLNLKQAYQQINAVALEFSKRICGDVNLQGIVDTAITSEDSSFPFTVRPYNWGKPHGSNVDFFTQMLLFELSLKIIEVPTAP